MIKRRIILVVISLLMMGLIIPMGSNNVSAATDTFNSNADLDGMIYSSVMSNNYTKALAGNENYTVDNSTTAYIEIGQLHQPGIGYQINRGYLSFDTSSIPDDHIILSTQMYVRQWIDLSWLYDFDVNIYRADYGSSLDRDDWNSTGDFEGILINSGSWVFNSWATMDMGTDNINLTGNTQYKMNTSREGTAPGISGSGESVYFYSADVVGSEPYLNIVSLAPTGMLVTHNFTQAGMWGENCTSTVYPEIQSWNNTADIYKYWIWSFNETYIQVQVNNSYSYLSVHPYCNVSVLNATTGLYNITETWNNTYHQVWFLVNKPVVETKLHIRVWHSTLGEGQPNWKWKLMICPGNFYDNTTAEWLHNMDEWEVTYGSNYTIAVLDFFDNVITEHPFVANALDQDVLIPIDIHTFKVKNLRRDTSLVSIYFNGTGDPFTQQLVIEETWAIPIRNGDYMFRFTYLTTNENITFDSGSSFYYNLTIDGDYTAYIGEDYIHIVYTDVNGLEIDVQNLYDVTIGPVYPEYINLPSVPVELTRASTPPTTNAFELRHPYAILEAWAKSNYSGVSFATFNDCRPPTGTVSILEDTLTISAPQSVELIINVTGGANIVNFTTNPGLVDLTQYSNTNNITVWSNTTMANIYRATKFRQSSVFYWSYYPSTTYYSVTLALNNSSPLDYFNADWYVAFYKDDNSRPDDLTATIYDLDNKIMLENGLHYGTSTHGFHMVWDRLNSSEVRNFRYGYFEHNDTPMGECPPVLVYDHRIMQHQGDDWYSSVAHWENPYSQNYEGEIKIILMNLPEGDLDYEGIWLQDETSDVMLTYGVDFYPLGNTIVIVADTVGEQVRGSTITYNVRWQMETMTAPGFPFFAPFMYLGSFGLSVYMVIFFFMLIVFPIGVFAVRRKESVRAFVVLALMTLLTWLLLGVIAYNVGSG